MSIIFCFWDKITFDRKNPNFFTFVSNYNMFTKWEETKQSLISIIPTWNAKFTIDLKNSTRKIEVQI